MWERSRKNKKVLDKMGWYVVIQVIEIRESFFVKKLSKEDNRCGNGYIWRWYLGI